MQKRWVGKDVDLILLRRSIEAFLEVNNLEIRKDDSADGCSVLGVQQRGVGPSIEVVVRISGDSNDFVVEFVGGERARRSLMWGFLTTMFGGGSFLLRGLKLKEGLEKLENEFWVHTEEAVTRLVGSTGCL